MKKTKIKVGILLNQFLKFDGTFNKNIAIKLSDKIAGMCYDEEIFARLELEESNSPLAVDTERYTHDTRCIFPYFLTMFVSLKNKNLTRKI